MTPLDIYARFRIYRGLIAHQLRVAAVGRFIAQRADGEADVDLVTRVGLFHDMGNIIKADLPRYQEFLEPEGLAHWEGVKREFIAKYGPDEHVATHAICTEMALGQEVLDLIENMRFSRTRWILEEGGLTQQICKYADLRVSPWGILPMRERLAEAKERYKGSPMDRGDVYTPESLATAAELCDELEAKLASHCDFAPSEITDASMTPIVEELKGYRVS